MQSRDPTFVELHGWIAANLTADPSVDRLAGRAGKTPRTFARLRDEGRTHAGETVDLMRLEAASRALELTDLPLKNVAVQSGYGDERTMRNAFQQHLGTNPAMHRVRFSKHA